MARGRGVGGGVLGSGKESHGRGTHARRRHPPGQGRRSCMARLVGGSRCGRDYLAECCLAFGQPGCLVGRACIDLSGSTVHVGQARRIRRIGRAAEGHDRATGANAAEARHTTERLLRRVGSERRYRLKRCASRVSDLPDLPPAGHARRRRVRARTRVPSRVPGFGRAVLRVHERLTRKPVRTRGGVL